LTSLKRVISEILLSRDFQVWEEEDFLFGRKEETEVVFLVLPDLDQDQVSRFLERFSDFKGSRIIVTLEEVSPSYEESLGENTYIWDREAVEHEIGRTRLEKVMGEPDLGLVDEISANDYPRVVSPEQLEDAGIEVGERIIRPIIDMADVKEISSQTVGGFRHRLELVPYYVFNFSAVLHLDGERMLSKSGTLSINALTRSVEPWQGGVETVLVLELNHKRLEPMIDSEEAEILAREEVVRLHTYERELIKDEGHATVMERKQVSPRIEDITTEAMGLYYLPVWCVEGVHGVMIINAGTGKIISEDYYRA
jgi:hypothetical protein